MKNETTNKVSHTPTPWQTDQDGFIESMAGTYIAEVSSDSDKAEAQADAEFIVRAVNSHEELLDALERIVVECNLDDAMLDVVRQIAEKAIAKAEGTL